MVFLEQANHVNILWSLVVPWSTALRGVRREVAEFIAGGAERLPNPPSDVVSLK